MEGNEAHQVIVPRLSCYVVLAGEEPWDPPGPFLCFLSFCFTLHNPQPDQHMPPGFVLLLTQQFWITPQLKTCFEFSPLLCPIITYMGLGADCCCSQLEVVMNTRAPEVDRAFPHLGAGRVAGKQINPPRGEESNLCVFISDNCTSTRASL